MALDKKQVIDALRAVIAESLDAVERVAAMARDEATSAETRSEGKYDTRSTEASYLARGQAERIAALRRLSAWFQTVDTGALEPPTVRVGALVLLEGSQKECVFIAPSGGNRATVDGQTVRVISPVSPIGRAMADLEAGDEFEVDTPRGLLAYAVVSVC